MIKEVFAVGGYNYSKLSKELTIKRIKDLFKKKYPKATIINEIELNLIDSNSFEALILYTEDD